MNRCLKSKTKRPKRAVATFGVASGIISNYFLGAQRFSFFQVSPCWPPAKPEEPSDFHEECPRNQCGQITKRSKGYLPNIPVCRPCGSRLHGPKPRQRIAMRISRRVPIAPRRRDDHASDGGVKGRRGCATPKLAQCISMKFQHVFASSSKRGAKARPIVNSCKINYQIN